LLIKKGRHAVNVVTDKWLEVPEDMDMKEGLLVVLGNKKTYEVKGFLGTDFVMVGPPTK
jgi:hypothetical protein